MTQRLDSDIPFPHGRIVPIGEENDKELTDLSRATQWIPYDRDKFVKSLSARSVEFKSMSERPRKVVWIVSHCYTRSRRHAYAKELQKYIQVDIFGGCGKRYVAILLEKIILQHKPFPNSCRFVPRLGSEAARENKMRLTIRT